MNFLKKDIITKFNLDPISLDKWYQNQIPGRSLLFWCLKKEKINCDQYLNWAQNYYKLPIINSSFFQKKPDLNMWKELHLFSFWSPEIIPIAKWNNITYIACLEPPENLTLNTSIQFVLTSINNLEIWWNKLKSIDFKNSIKEESKANILENKQKNKNEADEDNNTYINEENTQNVQFNDNISYMHTVKIDNIEKFNDPKQIAYDKFNIMKKYYNKSMILKIVDSNTLIPWIWDKNWGDKKNNQNMNYPLNHPSIFKIVQKTKKPYHGYIVANEINNTFFNDWNNSQIPEHITICPLIEKEQIIGMILGIGDDKIKYNESLNFMEQISKEISPDIKKMFN